MPDYKQMYLKLLDDVEKAINLLVDAQKKCEEIYIDTAEITQNIKKRRKLRRFLMFCIAILFVYDKMSTIKFLRL